MNKEKLDLLNLAMNFNSNEQTSKYVIDLLALMGEVVLESDLKKYPHTAIPIKFQEDYVEFLLLSGHIITVNKTKNLAKNYLVATSRPAFPTGSKNVREEENIF